MIHPVSLSGPLDTATRTHSATSGPGPQPARPTGPPRPPGAARAKTRRADRLTRRTVLAAAAASPLAGVLAACSGDPEPAAADRPVDDVTMLTSFGLLGRDCYAHVALDNGFFADRDLRVTVEPGAGANPNIQALLSGQAQFAVADFSGAIIAHGQDMTGVVALAAVQQLPLAALMSLDPDIADARDLTDRRVGLPAGAATDLLFDAWAQLAGLDDVQKVEMGAQDLVPALTSGQVDAIGQFLVGLPLVQQAAGDRTVTVLPYSDYITDLYGIALLTTRELADTDPDLCGRFRDGLLQGLEHAIEHPDEAGEILHEHNPSADPDVAAEELRLMAPYVNAAPHPLGHMDTVKVVQSVTLMESLGAIDDFIEPEELVDFTLVPGAEEPA